MRVVTSERLVGINCFISGNEITFLANRKFSQYCIITLVNCISLLMETLLINISKKKKTIYFNILCIKAKFYRCCPSVSKAHFDFFQSNLNKTTVLILKLILILQPISKLRFPNFLAANFCQVI